ncbi:MAG: hypothetical protein LBM93_09240 [Oscillospiraceae bacterium]|jgi:hypothetical protein|nr:hypothetical protein [Oscillospiraceae bacterium]
MSNNIDIINPVTKIMMTSKLDIKQNKGIEVMPIIDSENPKHIKEKIGNQLRLLRYYPLAFDFCCNMIHYAKQEAIEQKKDISVAIRDYSEDYYRSMFTSEIIANYLQPSPTPQKRRLKQQLKHELTNCYIIVENKVQLLKTPAFIFQSLYLKELKIYIHYILFLKEIFKNLVEGSSKNAYNGDGYVRVPANFYPLCTTTDLGIFNTYNPLYKLQLFGLSENTYRNKQITMKQSKLFRKIVPEYLDNKNNLKKSKKQVQETFTNQLKSLSSTLKTEWIVKDCQIHEYNKYCTLYW